MQTTIIQATPYIKKVFQPCIGKRHCEECTGAYYAESGLHMICSCEHHTQGRLFNRIESKQRSFF